MEKSNRYRFPKTTVFGFTLLFILVIVLTVVFFYKEPTKACAAGFLRVQIFALIIQLILNYINFRSEKKIVILATLFVSAMVLFSIITSFLNFRMMCELYPAF